MATRLSTQTGAVLLLATLVLNGAAQAQPPPFTIPPIIENGSLADVEEALGPSGESLRGAGQNAGATPLMAAALAGRGDIVALLLRKGAQPNRTQDARPNASHCSALYFATQGKHDDAGVLDALLKAGARVEGDPRCESPPLAAAAAQGKLVSVRFLLAKGANPRAMSLRGDIPLTAAMAAIAPNQTKLVIIDELVRRGATVNDRDMRGRTALMGLQRVMDEELCDALLARGIDPRITDTSGADAVHYAYTYEGLRLHRERLSVAAARMKGPIPPPVFSPTEIYEPIRIGKELRVGVVTQRREVVVVDRAGKPVGQVLRPLFIGNGTGAQVIDLDGDGVPDYSLRTEGEGGGGFSLVLCTGGGPTCLVLNYNSAADRLTGSQNLSAAQRAAISDELARRDGLDQAHIDRLWAAYHLAVDRDRMAAVAAWHQDALRAYRRRDFEGALARLDDLLASLNEVDPSGQDEQVSAILNDYGFFLAEAKRLERAIAVLQMVIARAPNRGVAYLNLADAQWASGDTSAAALNYRRYATLMKADGKEQKIPPRVGERSAR